MQKFENLLKNPIDKFNDLIRDQFEYGGQKYAQSDVREATDILFDRYSIKWLLGTMDKYTFRFKNLERERDLLKIATYCYILWLKRGYWVKDIGLMDVLDTIVKVKSENFPKFLEGYNEFISLNKDKFSITDIIDKMSSDIYRMSTESWRNITANRLYRLYYFCYLRWKESYSELTEHDTDTRNEEATAQQN